MSYPITRAVAEHGASAQLSPVPLAMSFQISVSGAKPRIRFRCVTMSRAAGIQLTSGISSLLLKHDISICWTLMSFFRVSNNKKFSTMNNQRRRRIANAEWESHKEMIQQLYLKEDKALEQVMGIMATTYDFPAR